jgi:hypothetical protein
VTTSAVRYQYSSSSSLQDATGEGSAHWTALLRVATMARVATGSVRDGLLQWLVSVMLEIVNHLISTKIMRYSCL